MIKSRDHQLVPAAGATVGPGGGRNQPKLPGPGGAGPWRSRALEEQLQGPAGCRAAGWESRNLGSAGLPPLWPRAGGRDTEICRDTVSDWAGLGTHTLREEELNDTQARVSGNK